MNGTAVEVSGARYVLNYSYVSGAPAAAFIDGEMWTAFKSIQILPRIRAYTLSDLDDTSWFLESYESAPLAVDPVSFLYADHGESLTIWTNSVVLGDTMNATRHSLLLTLAGPAMEDSG